MDRKHIEYLTPELLYSEEPIWVNPVGGLGDIIMLSTALKRSFDKYSKKFCIARRTQYTEFFTNHPAIQEIGHPAVGSYGYSHKRTLYTHGYSEKRYDVEGKNLVSGTGL